MSQKSIAVVGVTQAEAQKLAELLQQHACFASDAASGVVGISFTARTWNQPWPEKSFDELHWLCTNGEMPEPGQDITARAALVHVHYLAGEPPPRHPGIRTYVWRDTDELARFWASFHRTQALRSTLGLNWDSYESASRCATVCQTAAAWGASRVGAVTALLNDAPLDLYPTESSGVLLIEANHRFTLGDLSSLTHLTENALGFGPAVTLLLTEDYQGYGLKLLVLGQG